MCRRLAAACPAAAQTASARTAAFAAAQTASARTAAFAATQTASARTAAFAATRPAALGTLASARAANPGGTFAAPTLSTSTFLAAPTATALAPTT